MAADERAELQSLSRDELLDVFEGGLFELVTEGKEYSDLLEMTLALGIKSFMRDKLAGLDSEELIEMFLDSERVVVELVDYAAEQGLLDEE
ncbi:hypothetical protein [Desulfovibrio ferrophilus]|uniref:Carbamoyl-phosphate synthase small chain n=1 Tax=Desulfovibrio ferrophilus TaxID=241368 RepID=A0A2Z6B0E0_9BACT|nr:hypothetical protein [Desulfovibrio ferrophilus]BBD08962.1 carbamoyl-phosphate synthase small chain [Desulfovibrio ferrophilus]